MNTEINVEIFSQRLRELMEENNETVYSIAEFLHLSAPTISRYINAKMSPKLTAIQALAVKFNVNPVWLMGCDVEKHILMMKEEQAEYSSNKRIKVYGSIPAGIPLEAIEDVQDWEEIPGSWLTGNKEYIALKVKGDSMYPKYLENDTVIIQLAPNCENGQDCAVYINGYDATLKTVIKDVNSITLKPINPNYAPVTYKHPGEVKILGVVKEIRRKV